MTDASTTDTLSTPVEMAGALVSDVLRQRKEWLAAWWPLLIDPKSAVVQDYPPETVGVQPGSCRIVVGERVIATFIVRYRDCGVEVFAAMPQEA